MIIKSICFWIVIFIFSGLFMNHIFSRKEAYEQRLIELDEDIARIKAAYEREAKQKSELLKERQELSKKVEYETQKVKSDKLLLAAKVETELPPSEKTSSASVEQVIAKQIFWDQTPAEQGLNVGTWITIDGYPAGLIGAEIVGANGVITGWKWTNNKLWGDQAMVVIASQPTGYSVPADRIVNMVGFIEKPSSNKKVGRVNEAYVQKWGSSDSALIRVTAQISQISPPDPTNRYPGQWGVDLTDIDVEFVKE